MALRRRHDIFPLITTMDRRIWAKTVNSRHRIDLTSLCLRDRSMIAVYLERDRCEVFVPEDLLFLASPWFDARIETYKGPDPRFYPQLVLDCHRDTFGHFLRWILMKQEATREDPLTMFAKIKQISAVRVWHFARTVLMPELQNAVLKALHARTFLTETTEPLEMLAFNYLAEEKLLNTALCSFFLHATEIFAWSDLTGNAHLAHQDIRHLIIDRFDLDGDQDDVLPDPDGVTRTKPVTPLSNPISLETFLVPELMNDEYEDENGDTDEEGHGCEIDGDIEMREAYEEEKKENDEDEDDHDWEDEPSDDEGRSDDERRDHEERTEDEESDDEMPTFVPYDDCWLYGLSAEKIQRALVLLVLEWCICLLLKAWFNK